MKFNSETELAEKVVDWLNEHQWEVYQEVQISSFGAIADIVAVQKSIVWVIECKLTLSLSVVAQAMRWKWKSNYISVAVPHTSKVDTIEPILRKVEVGCILVNHGSVMESFKSPLARKAYSKDILKCLTEDHKTFAHAGNSNGLRWSPFKATCRNVFDKVSKSPGITMKELIDTIETHYGSPSTARVSLKHWIELGKVHGVEIKKEGKVLKLYPTSDTVRYPQDTVKAR